MYLIRRLTWSIGCFVVGDTLSTDAPGLIGTRCTLECPLFDSSVAPTELRSPTLHLSTYAPVSRATLTTCEIAWDACKYWTIGGYACAQCCCEPSMTPILRPVPEKPLWRADSEHAKFSQKKTLQISLIFENVFCHFLYLPNLVKYDSTAGFQLTVIGRRK